MKLCVKSLACITCFTSLSFFAAAQPAISFPGNSIAPDVKKVIRDYPNRFSNLQGELLIEHAQSADYACNFQVTGAERALVTRYSATNKTVASWEALVLTTEEFEAAKKKFKSLFVQLNNTSVPIDGAGSFQLKGRYEEPAEEKKFSSVLFSFQTEDEAMKKLHVEIVMLYEPMEWKVKVLVYDRDRDDAERGPRLD